MARAAKSTSPKTLDEVMVRFDAYARSEPDGRTPYEVYLDHDLILTIWLDPRRSGVPTPDYNPDNSPELRPLYRLAQRFGRDLLSAVRKGELAAYREEAIFAA